MKTKPASLVLVAVVALFHTATMIAQTTRGKQALNQPYLSQMPMVERVKAEMKGTDAMDTAARHMGAFWQLQEIIKELSGFRWTRNQLTPDEKRLLGQYAAGYQTAAQPYAHIQNAPSHPDKPKWYQMHAFYETSSEFREELFSRLLSPALRAEYARVKGETRAAVQARQEAREKAWKEEQAQAAPSGGAQPYKREEQAAQALLDGLVKATTELVGALNSQVQTSQPSTAEGYYELGNKYLKAQQCAEAIEAFKKAIALEPASAAYNDLGRAYYCRSQYSEAEAAFKEALRLKPDNLTTLFNLGRVYCNQTKMDEAQQVYLLLKSRDPAKAQQLANDIQEAKRAKELIAKSKEEIEKAKKQVAESRKAQPATAGQSSSVPQPSGSAATGADAYLAEGHKYRTAKDYPRAIETYKKAISLEPTDVAYYFLGRCYDDQRQYQLAIPAYKQSLALQPDAGVFLVLGIANHKLEKYDEALKAFRDAISLKPKLETLARAHFWIGRTYHDLRQDQNAVPALQEALRIKPDSAEAHTVLGGSYLNLGQYPNALTEYQQAVRLKPDDAEGHFWVGVVYNNLKQHDNAVPAFQEVLRLRPDDRNTMYHLGETYYKVKQYPDALTTFKQMLRLEPDHSGALYNLGITYVGMGKNDDALQVYRKLQTIDEQKAERLLKEINKSN